MRDRNRANKNEIEIFVFSVTSNDFPHDMLLLTFSSNLGSKLWCRRYLHGRTNTAGPFTSDVGQHHEHAKQHRDRTGAARAAVVP
jgi:hypothetical protein